MTLFICFVFIGASAQTLSFQECLDYAVKNSLSIEEGKLGIETQQLAVQNAKRAFYPSVSASVGNNYSFGRTIDPFSNAFVNNSITSLSMGVGAGITVFNGFRNQGNLEKQEKELLVSNENLELVQNQISLQVAQLYLQVLLAKERISIADSNIVNTAAQIERIALSIKAGAASKMQLLELEAQLKADEASKASADANFKSSVQQLKNALNYPFDETLNIQPADLSGFEARYSESDLTQAASKDFGHLPDVKRRVIQLESATINKKVANAGFYPTLTVGANLNSIYSSQSRLPENPRPQTFLIGQVEGSGANVFSSQTVFDYTTPGITTQLDNNFGQTIGLSLGIPIYSRGVTKNQVHQADISVRSGELQLNRTIQQLREDAATALASMQAAEATLESQEALVKALTELFDKTTVQFKAQAISYYDWLNVRNRLNLALLNQTLSKYDYVFKAKVFEFYLKGEIDI